MMQPRPLIATPCRTNRRDFDLEQRVFAERRRREAAEPGSYRVVRVEKSNG